MTGEKIAWAAVFCGGLWLGMGVFMTCYGRNDRKPWSVSWLRTLAVWLFITAPLVALLVFDVFVSRIPFPLLIVGGFAATLIAWAVARRIPAFGRWAVVVHDRQIERQQKGLL